jgi:ribosomal protein S18 acetylase RimI-like enzyme
MIIRVTDTNDAIRCDELLTKLINDELNYDNNLNSNFVVKDYFSKVIKLKNNYLLAFKDDNKIEAYLFIKAIKDDGLSENGFLIDGLYVESDYRNQGIASKLINEAIEIIKQEHGVFVDIKVMYNNLVAKRLYERFGFKPIRVSYRKLLGSD